MFVRCAGSMESRALGPSGSPSGAPVTGVPRHGRRPPGHNGGAQHAALGPRGALSAPCMLRDAAAADERIVRKCRRQRNRHRGTRNDQRFSILNDHLDM